MIGRHKDFELFKRTDLYILTWDQKFYGEEAGKA